MKIRLNRNLIKILLKSVGNGPGNKSILETYRFYVIARTFFSSRSGIFSLDELCDVLHCSFDYRSLHNRPGNKRAKFKKRLNEIFLDSFLFDKCLDGRYITNSERKIVKHFSKKGNSSKSSWYELPDINILKSKGNFRDFTIGMNVTGNKFRSNKKIAEQCKCSVRRIQKATAKNNANGTFKKQFNFIEHVSGTKKQIEKLRAELFNIHDIHSPKAVRRNGEWVLRLNAPNSYRCFVLSGVKGWSNAQPTGQVSNYECWFQPIKVKSKQLKLFGDDYKRWTFKEGVYNINNYIQDHSAFLNRI